MKENILQVVAAILLGLMIPGAVIRLTASAPETAPNATVSQSATQDGETQPGIWVLTADGNTQWMVLEEYLIGVILAEMPTTYAHDALCAQAVVARTYALKRQQGSRHPMGAVCTDASCCQAYIDIAQYLNGHGYEEDVANARRAAEKTAGMVVTYEGELIEATYYHCSGGLTEDSVVVWGVDYPYLQVVESPGEEEMDGYAESVWYSTADLEAMLDRTLPGTPDSWLGWTTYTVGGGVEHMLFAGIQYTGVELRKLLELNSTVFTMTAEGDGLRIDTLGKGHRVGMSQTGAQAMALAGNTWQQILAHYYPGTRIDKMEDLG
ncbi:MAG: SpoIID/LytB domain-containing protein [Ruminococcaceae bacterium]|nr:SpoIID/LytB domain-containing protein [Oscillospiraceae bacterium]